MSQLKSTCERKGTDLKSKQEPRDVRTQCPYICTPWSRRKRTDKESYNRNKIIKIKIIDDLGYGKKGRYLSRRKTSYVGCHLFRCPTLLRRYYSPSS